MTASLDNARSAYARKQAETAANYSALVKRLAADEPVAETVIHSCLEDSRKTFDDLQTDVDTECQRIKLRAEHHRLKTSADDTVIARRELITVSAARDREMQAIEAKYKDQIDGLNGRIRAGEHASMMLGSVANKLSLLGPTP